jgi:hypothetical protein
MKDHRTLVRAEEVPAEERGRFWNELIRISPGYEVYQQRTSREIPLMILYPS